MAKTNKVMIQVCLCGAGTKKEQAPTVPYSAEEMAEQIVACAKAGASIAHIHVREDKLIDGKLQIGYKSMYLDAMKIFREDALTVPCWNVVSLVAINSNLEGMVRESAALVAKYEWCQCN